MRSLMITLILMMVPTAAIADFSIKFQNTFDKKMTYMLYWLDNPFEIQSPFNMAGGELEALQSRQIDPLKAGKYLVVWQGTGRRTTRVRMEIEQGVTSVTVTPGKYVTQNWESSP